MNIWRMQESNEPDVNMRRIPSHRRQSSVGISFYRHEEQTHRRRFSYASSSWIRDADDNDEDADEASTRTGRSRPCSWGPVGDFFYRESLCFSESERSPLSHHECNLTFSKYFRTQRNNAESTGVVYSNCLVKLQHRIRCINCLLK